MSSSRCATRLIFPHPQRYPTPPLTSDLASSPLFQLTSHGVLKNGKPYNQEYLHIIRFNEDNKVVSDDEVRPYFPFLEFHFASARA